MRVGEDVGRAVGGSDGHVVFDAACRDLLGGPSRGPLGHDPIDLVPSRRALGQGGEARVVRELGSAHGGAQAREVGVGAGDDAHEEAVGRRVVVEGGRVREAVALALAHDSQAVVPGQRPLEDAQDGPVQGRVDDLAAPASAATLFPAGIAAVERRHRCERGERTGEVVRHGHARPDRRPIRVAREVQQPPERDAQTVQAGPRGVGPALSEHADAHVDELVGQVGGTEAPAFHGAGPEVLAQHVGRRHQPLEEILPLRLPQVAGDAPPSPPFDRPRQRVPGPVVDGHERPHAAHEVALAGQFDLDHVGSELAQQPRAERRGDPRADVDHPDARERPVRPVVHASESGWPLSRSAMTSRIEPLALRAASASSAVAELWTQ